MSLAPYARQVARVAAPVLLRWPDIPVGAVRQVTVDASDWVDQVTNDGVASIAATVTPDDGGLEISGAAEDDGVLGVTIEATSAGIGTDYAVTLTATTTGGRVEPYAVRVLVTDPTASA